MKLFVFATYEEAKASIYALNAKQTDVPHLFTFDKGEILLTGMGPEKALLRMQEHVKKADYIYNLGIVGALHKNIADDHIHTVKEASFCADDLSKATAKNCPTISLNKDGIKLLTIPAPLYDPEIRDHLSAHFDAVDMEGFQIAYVAQAFKKPCSLHKIVSDFCNKSTSDDILKKLPEFSYLLAQKIQTLV